MAKKEKDFKSEVVEQKSMSMEESRAYRASLHKPEAVQLTDEEKKETFRIFWAQAKASYGKQKDLEGVLWAHLKASKHDEPEKFEAGLAHFGLKKIR